MKVYKSVIVGLTGIGARRPESASGIPVYGEVGRSHAAAYHQHPQTNVVGVCDIRPEALSEFKDLWGDVWPDVRCYTDYRELLEHEQPDIVSVVTPDHLHADITIEAACGSACAVLCEKPIATTLADADRMIEVTAEEGVLLSVEHTRRWSHEFHLVRQLIRSGTHGSLRNIVANLYGPRAMLFRNGTHTVDMICFFAESDPEWLTAALEPGFEGYGEYLGDGGHDPASEPSANAFIQFANGVRAYYNSAKSNFTGMQFELLLDDARIEVSDRRTVVITSSGHLNWSYQDMVSDRAYAMVHQAGAVAELVQVLDHGGTLASPGTKARQSLEILLAMLQSHVEGNAKVAMPLA
ncbi:MAG: Gfo/Idh/MocA family oxidoreductase [Caldilineaceae bacterium]|nr:Gfo/Idh/MocA family oxidoreductase [Caldilineaceae bacterium]